MIKEIKSIPLASFMSRIGHEAYGEKRNKALV